MVMVGRSWLDGDGWVVMEEGVTRESLGSPADVEVDEKVATDEGLQTCNNQQHRHCPPVSQSEEQTHA